MKTRLQAAWHVLMGRPLIFGCHFKACKDGEHLYLEEAKHILITKNQLD